MRTKTNKLRILNLSFYNLIKSLQKNHFTHSALIASYAYEEFLNELIKMHKHH